MRKKIIKIENTIALNSMWQTHYFEKMVTERNKMN